MELRIKIEVPYPTEASSILYSTSLQSNAIYSCNLKGDFLMHNTQARKFYPKNTIKKKVEKQGYSFSCQSSITQICMFDKSGSGTKKRRYNMAKKVTGKNTK